MNNLYTMPAPGPDDAFDQLLQSSLNDAANPVIPQGLSARLLAALAQPAAGDVVLFSSSVRMQAPRSSASTWTAVAAHAAAILLIALTLKSHLQIAAPMVHPTLVNLTAPPPQPLAIKQEKMGGGGGQRDLSPVTQGHLPRLAQVQIVPPKAPPTIAPKLAMEPAVVVQPNLQLADNKMPDLGMPTSTLKGFSLGDGSGTGIGSGNGSGVGPGSGGNMGGGVLHIGGAVRAPILVSQVDPEFSEEARKAKFSGNVEVYLIVNEQGSPEHVRCVRDIGMGLCGKAIDAVRQYRFKPATQNGRAVKVDMYIEVNFQIF